MRDILSEVFTSMKSNKMRIALTGFSIGWGLFILIVLLGAGNGLLKGMMSNFSNSTDNIYTIIPGTTSMVYKGQPKNKAIYFTPEDTVKIKKAFPEHVAYIKYTLSDTTSISSGKIKTAASIEGQQTGFERIEHIKITHGRSINQWDIDSNRKVCVLSSSLTDIIFPEEKQLIGKQVTIGSISFLVVGIYEPNVDIGGTLRTVYTPCTTALHTFCPENHLSKISIMTRNLDDLESNRTFESNLRKQLARQKDYHLEDLSAISLKSDYENYLDIMTILKGIYLFIVIIGLATMVSGVVGVSNIMMITVKERTRELGVRKAMGASNEHIVALVLVESVIITLIFGYVGMLFGIGLTQLLSAVLAAFGGSAIFGAPTVGLGIIFAANVVMLLAGIIAGYVPAKKAINCKLVDALAA